MRNEYVLWHGTGFLGFSEEADTYCMQLFDGKTSNSALCLFRILPTMASAFPVYKNLDEIMKAMPEYGAQADYYAMYSR